MVSILLFVLLCRLRRATRVRKRLASSVSAVKEMVSGWLMNFRVLFLFFLVVVEFESDVISMINYLVGHNQMLSSHINMYVLQDH